MTKPSQRGIWLLCLLFFWAVALFHLDRLPPIHNDEVTIFAPGYKLFSQGVYGLDMYTGFHGQERLYLEIQPLMPLLQGLAARFLGVGVWQMRFLPVVYGLLTFSLTLRLARQAPFGRQIAPLMAAFLLLCWQWSPAGAEFASTGLPLLDYSRLARYDILMSPLTLALWWGVWQVAHVPRPKYFWGLGFGVGVACLGHLYALFWLPVIAILGFYRRLVRPATAVAFLGGFLVPLGSWVYLVVTHWQSFVGQYSKHNGRFDLTNPFFYAQNLLTESHRYALGLGEPATLWRVGFWLVLALPFVCCWLAYHAYHGKGWAIHWLTPALLLPVCFALLVSKKNFAYLLLVWPLWVVGLAWCGAWLWQKGGTWPVLLGMGAVVLFFQGAWAMGQAAQAAQRPSPLPFFAALHQTIPAGAIVLGPQMDWFALPNAQYRAIGLPFLLSDPDQASPLSFTAALAQIAPTILILDEMTLQSFAIADQTTPLEPSRLVQLQTYMAQHHAQQIGELVGINGTAVQIYSLYPP